MGLRSFNAFYSEFIKLEAKLKFIKEILLQEFIYKLSLLYAKPDKFWIKISE